MISAINWHTHLVDNDEPLAQIDAALAKRAAAWGELSDYRLEQAIAFWVDRHDPDALRRIGVSARCRDLYVGKNSDQSDTTAVWGRLYATDAAALHAPPDPQISGEDSPPLDPPARERVKPSAGLLMGGGIVPTPLLAELIRCAATVSHVHPGGDTRESGYVPSAKLAEFVRVRDLTFRFPVAR